MPQNTAQESKLHIYYQIDLVKDWIILYLLSGLSKESLFVQQLGVKCRSGINQSSEQSWVPECVIPMDPYWASSEGLLVEGMKDILLQSRMGLVSHRSLGIHSCSSETINWILLTGKLAGPARAWGRRDWGDRRKREVSINISSPVVAILNRVNRLDLAHRSISFCSHVF